MARPQPQRRGPIPAVLVLVAFIVLGGTSFLVVLLDRAAGRPASDDGRRTSDGVATQDGALERQSDRDTGLPNTQPLPVSVTPSSSSDTRRPTSDAAAPDAFGWSGAALDITLKLLAVLALAYVSLAALRRYSLGTSLGRRKGRLQVLESTTLAPNRSIFLIRVGETQLLVGVTSSQISTLASWDSSGTLRDSEAAADWPEVERPWPAGSAAGLFAADR